MNMLGKVLSKLRSIILSNQNGVHGVIIRDFANAYIAMRRLQVQGSGILKLNPNSIHSKETMKLRIDEDAKLIINGTVSFFTNTNIHIGKNAVLSIDDGTYINEGTKISIKTKCSIGKNCAISNDVTILDSDFHTIIDDNSTDTGVIIGNHVWIGADATILKNVKIGNDCIIGAKSVVLKDVPDGCIVVGNPARIIRQNVNWE